MTEPQTIVILTMLKGAISRQRRKRNVQLLFNQFTNVYSINISVKTLRSFHGEILEHSNLRVKRKQNGGSKGESSALVVHGKVPFYQGK